ncbi:alpha/beta hydrolase [uncultured Lacinutrix sp.]|uniref:alpha/beta hydrolase n=1 Tax=uncultured Lacinutrix sp. TaxID=574032 RepID=UPI0026061A87|nr:alpha/beta hydrolase [uncultured Lacinutrix sp.]
MILQYKGTTIFYTDEGKGSVVILLHGFLEDTSMWNDAKNIISKKNRVICIDLLGHGKTGSIGYIHTMEDMANMVYFVLKHLKLRKYTFIGHSMGGYVALTFAKLYTQNVKGLCLLNSTYKADSSERKILRTRANKMVQNNFENMVRMSFANLFSAESKTIYKEEYEAALLIALKTPLQGYMAAQEGMKLREDSSSFFIEAPFKKMILLGEKDTVLDTKNILQFSNKNNIPIHVFTQGHMSHIENKSEFLKKIMYFIE